VYRVPGEKADYEVISYGKDGKPGGTGEDADLGVQVVSNPSAKAD
jgi:general secretion pathway protein G